MHVAVPCGSQKLISASVIIQCLADRSICVSKGIPLIIVSKVCIGLLTTVILLAVICLQLVAVLAGNSSLHNYPEIRAQLTAFRSAASWNMSRHQKLHHKALSEIHTGNRIADLCAARCKRQTDVISGFLSRQQFRDLQFSGI